MGRAGVVIRWASPEHHAFHQVVSHSASPSCRWPVSALCLFVLLARILCKKASARNNFVELGPLSLSAVGGERVRYRLLLAYLARWKRIVDWMVFRTAAACGVRVGAEWLALSISGAWSGRVRECWGRRWGLFAVRAHQKAGAVYPLSCDRGYRTLATLLGL